MVFGPLRIPKSTHSVSECTQGFQNLLKGSKFYSRVPNSTQEFQNLLKGSKFYSRVPKSTHSVSECTQGFQNLITGFPNVSQFRFDDFEIACDNITPTIKIKFTILFKNIILCVQNHLISTLETKKYIQRARSARKTL